MKNYRKLADKLVERLRDANTILAYLNQRNFIDDEEAINKTWEIIAEARNEIDDPENDMKDYEFVEIFERYSRIGIGGTNCRLMTGQMFIDACKHIINND